jgi:hypothetical protein
MRYGEPSTPLLRYTPTCTEEQWKIIRTGMSVADVAAILHCPPGEYTRGRAVYISFIDPFPADEVARSYAVCWCGQQGAIGLELEKDGTVRRADWYPALECPPD